VSAVHPTPRQRAIHGLAAGDVFRYTRRFTEEDSRRFGDLTLDYNPVHYDERFARAKGYPRPICHGLLVGSLLCSMGGQVAWLATGMSFRFRRPVYFGDAITCTVTVTSVDERGSAEAEVVCVNQDGIEVVSAHMTGRLPIRADERAVLEAMVAEGDPTNKLRHWPADPSEPLRAAPR